ncbi:CLUMA_CG003207, isoform A [Clunio marinus]|uniref:CLUMA_CG003207, isoform A n=1 Tax=Clunio marinus TaxID=568069 RepID=A0A1J1HN39_9DIPT|nr:CLUMA_CG003207, isoform A [Clunio marinus]
MTIPYKCYFLILHSVASHIILNYGINKLFEKVVNRIKLEFNSWVIKVFFILIQPKNLLSTSKHYMAFKIVSHIPLVYHFSLFSIAYGTSRHVEASSTLVVVLNLFRKRMYVGIADTYDTIPKASKYKQTSFIYSVDHQMSHISGNV